MSLTSYRTAPPRVNLGPSDPQTGREDRGGEREEGIAGLAATYSSAAGAAVPLARRVFTAEFGMGSGVWPLAMATRPANECHVTDREVSGQGRPLRRVLSL